MTRGVAIIGAGFIAYMHALAVRATPGLALAAIASRSRETALHRGRILDAPAYTFAELGEMLSRDDVEIAVVGGPNAFHADHALAAIEHGRHVIVEKPLVLTLSEADRIAAAAREWGVQVGYAENLVFAPIVRRAREVVQEGALGAVRAATCQFKHAGPPATGWFRSADLAGGGAHLDLGCHALELMRSILGRPAVTAIRRCEMQIDEATGLDLVASCDFETDAGVLLTTEASWIEPAGSTECVITGEAAVLTLNTAGPGRLEVAREGEPPQMLEVPHDADRSLVAPMIRSGYVAQMASFADAFASGAPPEEGLADGREILRLLAAGYASAAARRPVNPADVPPDVTPIGLLLTRAAGEGDRDAEGGVVEGAQGGRHGA